MTSSNGPANHQRHRIAMVCDFFYPRLGGVENHIWSLSHSLLRLGHKVIVITHAYNCSDAEVVGGDYGLTRRKSQRTGVRYLPGGLKVYYCPFLPMTDEDCLPTFKITFPLLHWILIRQLVREDVRRRHHRQGLPDLQTARRRTAPQAAVHLPRVAAA
jgi:phosphatidylinositol glycan class A protein